MPQHGKSLARVYKDAVSKRTKTTESPQAVKLRPGCHDKEIPSQRSNHSLDLPGDWLRHSLWRRVAAAAIRVLRALTAEPSLKWPNCRPF